MTPRFLLGVAGLAACLAVGASAEDSQRLAPEQRAKAAELLEALRKARDDASARDHCRGVKTRGFFSHDSPVPGKADFCQRARNFGAFASAENIAYGRSAPCEVNGMWFLSPGHQRNMLNSGWSQLGLGRFETHGRRMFR